MHVILDIGSDSFKIYSVKKLWSESFFAKKNYQEEYLSPMFFKKLSDFLIEHKVTKVDLLISGQETFMGFYQEKDLMIEEQEFEQFSSFYPYVDYQITKNQWGKILYGYNTQIVEKIKSFFSSMGIKINKIDNQSFYLIENIKKDEENFYFIDFGHESLRIYFFYKKKLFFYKKIYLAGRHLIEEIQKSINVTYQEGKILKEDVDFYSDELRHLVESFYTKVQESLSYYVQPNYKVLITGSELENRLLKRKLSSYKYLDMKEIFL